MPANLCTVRVEPKKVGRIYLLNNDTNSLTTVLTNQQIVEIIVFFPRFMIP